MKQRLHPASSRACRGLAAPLLVSLALCTALRYLGCQPLWARLAITLFALRGAVVVSVQLTSWRAQPLQALAHLTKLAVAVLGPLYVTLGVHAVIAAQGALSWGAEATFTVGCCALIGAALAFFFLALGRLSMFVAGAC